MSQLSAQTPLLSIQNSTRRLANPSPLWRTGVIFVAVGMGTEAFGNHALKLLGFPQDRVEAFLTASRYAIYNGLGLCIVSLHPRFSKHRFAGPAIAVGGFIFSATIMIVVLSRGFLSGLSKLIPFGPAIAIAGYVSLAF